MHTIEPHYNWRDRYESERDEYSPFHGREYSEFQFSQKVYNYYIHPQWDNFGSPTLYMKILFAEYEEGYAIIELIGEWNDAVTNDIMFLKRDVMDALAQHGISKYILICENVLNFHGSDDCYYEEWQEDASDEKGWICFINLLQHVQAEMEETQIQFYVNMGSQFNDVIWRPLAPKVVFRIIENLIHSEVKQLRY
ncbi:MAG: hypothetical protein AB8H03_11275 [Saprospiraceae bacterium]